MSAPKFDTNSHLCKVCGKHKGKGFDHAKCSRIKQAEAQAVPKTKRRVNDNYLNHFTKLQ